MVDLDTNALVRFLVGDDPSQFGQARRLIKREASSGDPVLISLLTQKRFARCCIVYATRKTRNEP